nr:MAG TPA: protein of unknown function DUF1737 [Caudoviricetes sp.]
MDQTTMLGDYEQAILDSCDDETIMQVNEMLAEGWDFYEALESLGLI